MSVAEIFSVSVGGLCILLIAIEPLLSRWLKLEDEDLSEFQSNFPQYEFHRNDDK